MPSGIASNYGSRDKGGGAVYVALAAAVDSVIAWPGARIGTLPRAAIINVLGGREAAEQQDLVAAGVVDRRMARTTAS